MEKEVKHVKSEEYYEVTVRLTPREYELVKNNALWDGSTIAGYLRQAGLGNKSRGC